MIVGNLKQILILEYLLHRPIQGCFAHTPPHLFCLIYFKYVLLIIDSLEEDLAFGYVRLKAKIEVNVDVVRKKKKLSLIKYERGLLLFSYFLGLQCLTLFFFAYCLLDFLLRSAFGSMPSCLVGLLCTTAPLFCFFRRGGEIQYSLDLFFDNNRYKNIKI